MATKSSVFDDDDDDAPAKAAKAEPAAKVVKPTADELTDVLRDMVIAAENTGGRDRQEVIRARLVLDRADPPPPPVEPEPQPAPPPA